LKPGHLKYSLVKIHHLENTSSTNEGNMYIPCNSQERRDYFGNIINYTTFDKATACKVGSLGFD
jgi:hypothetical protein